MPIAKKSLPLIQVCSSGMVGIFFGILNWFYMFNTRQVVDGNTGHKTTFTTMTVGGMEHLNKT